MSRSLSSELSAPALVLKLTSRCPCGATVLHWCGSHWKSEFMPTKNHHQDFLSLKGWSPVQAFCLFEGVLLASNLGQGSQSKDLG